MLDRAEVAQPTPASPGVPATRRLNLGCGKRFAAGWTNVDVTATGPGVLAHNLRAELPFEPNSFDVVYHSHVLEHLARAEAPAFIAECYRVARHGGVVRVAAPDLERIARDYLDALDHASRDDRDWAERYQWIMLEMYDQTVRDLPGGEMAKRLRNPSRTLRQFVLERLGAEARNLIPCECVDTGTPEPLPPMAARKRLWRRIAASVRHPGRIRELLIQRLLGREYEMLQVGRFRGAGEIHQWMYDRYSLSRLLGNAGFVDVKVCGASESRIAGWTAFNLDTEPDGSIYKPDSLYMEAVKP